MARNRLSLQSLNTAFRRPNDESRKKAEAWDKMLHYYMYRKDDFLRHYRMRSNVETTFHMIKSKFGSRIRSKSAAAMINEVLRKIPVRVGAVDL